MNKWEIIRPSTQAAMQLFQIKKQTNKTNIKGKANIRNMGHGNILLNLLIEQHNNVNNESALVDSEIPITS